MRQDGVVPLRGKNGRRGVAPLKTASGILAGDNSRALPEGRALSQTASSIYLRLRAIFFGITNTFHCTACLATRSIKLMTVMSPCTFLLLSRRNKRDCCAKLPNPVPTRLPRWSMPERPPCLLFSSFFRFRSHPHTDHADDNAPTTPLRRPRNRV